MKVKYRDRSGNKCTVDVSTEKVQEVLDEWWEYSDYLHNHPDRKLGYKTPSIPKEVIVANALTELSGEYNERLRDLAV